MPVEGDRAERARPGAFETAFEGDSREDREHDQPNKDVEAVKACEGEESCAEKVAAHGHIVRQQPPVFRSLTYQEDQAEHDGGDKPEYHPVMVALLQALVGAPYCEADGDQCDC